MKVWKFGCRWGGHAVSFYKFIRDESIVIGHNPHAAFKLDDLVLITEGFTVKAIAQVDERPRSITESDYRFVTNQYGIEWLPSTLYAKAEWYELPPDLRFEYRLQRGAAQVNKADIVKRARELWNSRK